jgi:hypothetical protein
MRIFLPAFLILTTTVFAQSDVGRIVGTVADSTGAVIPGASISVKNEKTGQERSVKSDSQGYFIVTQLPPASYTIVGSSSGLGPQEYREVRLAVGQERMLNIVLMPASVNTEVTISGGELAVVDTSSARVGVNVSEREVATLPLNGRQVSQLYLLTPGAVNAGSGSFDDIRFSGRASEQNAIRFDGIEGSAIVDTNPGNLNGESSSVFRLQASMENIQEFRVESNNYPAEFGTGTGGQISVITKSGSNDFHGSLFEYVRNDALDARNAFDGAAKSKLRLNQSGGSFGGRLIRDKTFFFASIETLKQRTSAPYVETTPSAAAWAQVTDPSILKLRRAFPVGQFSSPDPNFDVVNVVGNNQVDEYYGGIRLDHNFTDKYRLSLRYFRDQGTANFVQNSTLSTYVQSAVPQNAMLNFQQVLTPTVINETKFGFNGYKTRVEGVPGPSPDFDLSGVTVNLTGSIALAGIAGQAGSAGIAAPSGLIRLSSSFNGRGAPYTNYTMSFIDNLSVARQQHNMKFGVEFRPIRLYNDQQGGTTYSFPSITAFINNQPSQVQFIGDLSQRSPFTGLTGNIFLKQMYSIFYAQDEWKLRPNVTLSYGLRYEFYSPLHEDRNKNVFFDMTKGNIIPGFTGDWYHSSKLNFGPRLALSWAPDRFKGKTVFRVGSGYYYGPGQTEDQLQPAANDRISTTITSGSSLRFPLDTQSVLSSYNINSPTLGFQPRAYAPGYSIPEKILQYTASVQQELPGNTVLTVAYVGSQGRNLFLRSVTNRITGVTTDPATGKVTMNREFGPRFAEIDYKTSGGTSHYNALQSTINRRFARGLTLGGQYTWAHDIGNTAGSNEARTSANNYDFGADYGNNNFDIRHSFNFSALYELPYGRGRAYGKNVSGLSDAFLGGWQLGGIMNARSGAPVEVLITRADVVCQNTTTGVDSNLGSGNVCPTGAVGVVNVPGGGNSRNIRRPDYVAGVNPYLKTGVNWINPAAFAVPQPGTYGNLARNAFKGPGLAQFDLTLSKRFRIGEKAGVEFRSEFYNLLNHANFQAPGGGVIRLTDALGTGANKLQPGQAFSAGTAGGNFGNLTSTVSNQIGLGTNRQIQLALRFSF